MFIYLDALISDYIHHEKLRPCDIDAFSNLARFIAYGKHLVGGDIRALTALADLNEIGDDRFKFLQARNRLSERNSSLDQVSHYIRVIPPVHGPLKRIPYKAKEIVRDLSFFDGYHYGPGLIAIGEDNTDIVIYELIARWYMSKERIGGITLEYTSHPGGGNSTSEVVVTLHAQSPQTIALVITDSDKVCHDCPMGQVAQRVSDAFKDLPLNFALFIPGVREIENLLSDSIFDYKDFKTETGEVSSTVLEELKKYRAFIEHCDANNLDHYLHAQVKKGLKICDMPQNSTFPKFQDYHCDSPDRCKNPCSGSVTQGLNPHELKTLIKESRARHHIPQDPPRGLIPLWGEVGSVFFSWACASPAFATR